MGAAIPELELLKGKELVAASATYVVLVHGLRQNCYLSKALEVFQEAENGDDIDAFAYSGIVKGLCSKSISNDAALVLDQMVQNGWKPNPHVFSCQRIHKSFKT